jgi:hypothetical protein
MIGPLISFGHREDINMTSYSFTRISRYLDNEARAYAHYVLHDETAYDTKPNDALVYGKIAHAELAGEKPELTKEEHDSVYRRGIEEAGVKVAFKTLSSSIELAKHIRGSIINGNFKTEQNADNGVFEGRFDLISDDAILDYKFVTVKDFDRVWGPNGYDDWIYSTHYLTQALIYLNMADREHYYIVAIDKSSLKYRVYDVANVKYNQDMIESLQDEVNRIEDIESGITKPVFKNDLSDWSINKMHSQPINIVVPDMLETNL